MSFKAQLHRLINMAERMVVDSYEMRQDALYARHGAAFLARRFERVNARIAAFVRAHPSHYLNETRTDADGTRYAWNGSQWRKLSPITGEYFK